MSGAAGIGAIGNFFSGITNTMLGLQALDQQKKINSENLNMQKEFAQNSIQWRVKDAKAAGIHPLYALGANGNSYTPQSFDSSAYQQIGQGFSDIGNALAIAGQKLQNDLLASQVEAQKISNASQKSELFSKINDGLAQRYFMGNLLDNGLESIAGVDPKDYSQVAQEYATEHPIASKFVDALNKPDYFKHKYDLDVLGSLGHTNKWRPKGESTFWDIGVENLKDYARDIYNKYKNSYNYLKDYSKMDGATRKRFHEALKMLGLD